MGNALEKWKSSQATLDVERRRMQEALSRLDGSRGEPCAARQKPRLIFGLDLTGSREHSLQHARVATAAMFEAIKRIGEISVNLIWYRGEDCQASGWHENPEDLCRLMKTLSCEGGYTQIARLIKHALTSNVRLTGIVFVGDHCEDNATELVTLAGQLKSRSIPLFIFHECSDHDERSLEAKPIFKRMAAASGGVYVEFKRDSGTVLREMLTHLAAFSAGGADALTRIALPATQEAQTLKSRLLLSAGTDPKRLK